MGTKQTQQNHKQSRRNSTLLAETAACIRFFSRIPLPRLAPSDDPESAPDFTRIARAIPLAGFLIALPAALLIFLLGFSALPPLAIGLLATGLLTTITGALHEDGLADVADGFFGGHTPDRRLSIMKDSRIGAFGALALVIAIGLKATLIAGALERFGSLGALTVLLAAESLSRFLLVWQWARLPPARPDGLGSRFGRPESTAVRQAAIATLICLSPALLLLPLTAALSGLALALISSYGLGLLAKAKVGGFTGDVLGAIQQVSGLGFYAGLMILW